MLTRAVLVLVRDSSPETDILFSNTDRTKMRSHKRNPIPVRTDCRTVPGGIV